MRVDVSERLANLLPRWIKHNESHIEQLTEWAAHARGAELAEAAAGIEAAAQAIAQANRALQAVADNLQGNQS